MTEQDTRCGVCGYVHPPEGFVEVVGGGPSRIEMIHEEAEAWQRLRNAITQLVEAVDSYPYLWNIGDGRGGRVTDLILEALAASGYRAQLLDPYEPGRPKAKKQLPVKLRAQVMARDYCRCVHCGCDDIEELGVDHILPESKGGPHTLDNLQTLCGSCNSKKGVRV